MKKSRRPKLLLDLLDDQDRRASISKIGFTGRADDSSPSPTPAASAELLHTLRADRRCLSRWLPGGGIFTYPATLVASTPTPGAASNQCRRSAQRFHQSKNRAGTFPAFKTFGLLPRDLGGAGGRAAALRADVEREAVSQGRRILLPPQALCIPPLNSHFNGPFGPLRGCERRRLSRSRRAGRGGKPRTSPR